MTATPPFTSIWIFWPVSPEVRIAWAMSWAIALLVRAESVCETACDELVESCWAMTACGRAAATAIPSSHLRGKRIGSTP